MCSQPPTGFQVASHQSYRRAIDLFRCLEAHLLAGLFFSRELFQVDRKPIQSFRRLAQRWQQLRLDGFSCRLPKLRREFTIGNASITYGFSGTPNNAPEPALRVLAHMVGSPTTLP